MGNIKNFIKQKIKNAAANGIGKFTAKKLDPETKKSFLKGLFSGAKKDIERFVISIDNIDEKDIFLSESFLENMTKAINNVKKPSRFKKYIDSYKQIFKLWEKTKKDLIKNFKILKVCIELNNDTNLEVDEFWENNKEILSDMKTAQKRSSDLDQNKNRLELVTKELGSLEQQKLELQKQLKSANEKYAKSKKEAEDKKHELQKDMLNLYNAEKNKLETDREKLKQELNSLPENLSELHLENTEESYENLTKNLQNNNFENLKEIKEQAEKSLQALEDTCQNEIAANQAADALEKSKNLVVEALQTKKLPEGANVTNKTGKDQSKIQKSLTGTLDFIEHYNQLKECTKVLQKVNLTKELDQSDIKDEDKVQFYDCIDDLLHQDLNHPAVTTWWNLKSQIDILIMKKKDPSIQPKDRKMLTIVNLVTRATKQPTTKPPEQDVSNLLNYLQKWKEAMESLKPINTNSKTDTWTQIERILDDRNLQDLIPDFKDYQEFWTNLNDYCGAITFSGINSDRPNIKVMIMKLIINNKDPRVKEDSEKVLQYKSEYNKTIQTLKTQKETLKQKIATEYSVSYPALIDIKNINCGVLIQGSRIYHIARVYLGLVHPIEQGYDKRRSALLTSLNEINYNYSEDEIDQILNFVENKSESKLETTKKEKNTQLQQYNSEINSLTKQREECQKELKLTVNSDKILQLKDQMNTRLVNMRNSVMNVLMTLSKIRITLKPLYEKCNTELTSQNEKVEKSEPPESHGFTRMMTILDFVSQLYGYIDALLDKKQTIEYKAVTIEKPKSYKYVLQMLHSSLKYRNEIYKYAETNLLGQQSISL